MVFDSFRAAPGASLPGDGRANLVLHRFPVSRGRHQDVSNESDSLDQHGWGDARPVALASGAFHRRRPSDRSPSDRSPSDRSVVTRIFIAARADGSSPGLHIPGLPKGSIGEGVIAGDFAGGGHRLCRRWLQGRWPRRIDVAPAKTAPGNSRRRFAVVGSRRTYCWMMISARRLACSRTPSAVGTAGSASPRPAVVIWPGEMPWEIRALRTESARRSERLAL